MKIWSKITRNKYTEKLIGVFCQGLSGKEIFLAGILGSVIGVMPFFGVSTLISSILAIRSKLNVGVALFFTYAVSPFHPILFIPFIRLGASLYGAEHTLLTFEAINHSFQTNVMDTVQKLSLDIVYGLTGWSTIAIPLLLLVIYFQKPRHQKYLEQNMV